MFADSVSRVWRIALVHQTNDQFNYRLYTSHYLLVFVFQGLLRLRTCNYPLKTIYSGNLIKSYVLQKNDISLHTFTNVQLIENKSFYYYAHLKHVRKKLQAFKLLKFFTIFAVNNKLLIKMC